MISSKYTSACLIILAATGTLSVSPQHTRSVVLADISNPG